MASYHSTLAHSAYHDLLASLRDEAVSDIRGTPTRTERKGRVYWYDTYRVGSDVPRGMPFANRLRPDENLLRQNGSI